MSKKGSGVLDRLPKTPITNGALSTSGVVTEVLATPGVNIWNLPGTLREDGWDLPGDLSYEEWEAAGRTLGEIGKAYKFWIGDWFGYGEHRYGEKYSQAINDLKLSYGELAKYASISRAVPKDIRRKGLSWSHHEAVAPLDTVEDRSRILEAAEKYGLNRETVRKVVKAVKENNGEINFGPASPLVVIHPPAENFTSIAEPPEQCTCHCHKEVCSECLKPIGPF